MPELARLHILVIEDDMHTRNMLGYLLQIIGIKHIHLAENGAEGLNFLDNPDNKIDVVLADWNMPCLNGMELLQQVRNHHHTLPFIIISGRMDQASIQQAKEKGVSAYLHKPISPSQLEQKLRYILQLKKS